MSITTRSLISYLTAASVAIFACHRAGAHDIYTGLQSKTGGLCCGGSDCAATTYRERGENYEFLTREGHWITIPVDRIQFLPIPGDTNVGKDHLAHLCYRGAISEYDTSTKNLFTGEGQTIFLYCVFVPPGGA